MKNKHYAPGNKKPHKPKCEIREICIDDVPDSYFSNEHKIKSEQVLQTPYLLNHKTNITKNRFN